MNKSLVTNLLALIALAAGYWLDQSMLLFAGLFAFSGAITNWLAIHMLFEKVPGLYGSGVIPARFEDFKLGIKSLMMEQFFTTENIDRFLSQEMNSAASIDLKPVIEEIDLEPSFDGLVEVILNSQFGGMLTMMGGQETLAPLKQPFIEKMKQSMLDISQQDEFKQNLKAQLEQPDMLNDIRANVDSIIDQRLSELTPQLVKEIIQKMIREHLGWLVVWGGVFGGVIGVLSALVGVS
ncbi:DUF445 domain-containing protein [Motilimonas cestriensis]|uniref:DUF445 domain-containing protein n=1 Tax=Motilimonas cestriensis TaxID=2742685 RepID=A0ABS8WAW1_9GAMM|nr:DUF445 domain-containing protein [Motilimonas cestriensis]MCE2596174.1 DUF445 domain-containing protein [Motilimonas cestriensis]